MTSKPMTKEQFVDLLHAVLKEKQQNDVEYAEPYDGLYNKCLLGYDLSHAKHIYEEDKFNFKITKTQTTTIEASSHLKFVIETLVKCYGKEEVVNILRDM
jgi:hypothetical protein